MTDPIADLLDNPIDWEKQYVTKQKISLRAQIEEVEYELGMRRKVYPGLVRRGKVRQGEADLHVERLEAVLKTLQWLQANETRVREGSA